MMYFFPPPPQDAPPQDIDPRRRFQNRHVERVFNPDRKDTHWGKRKPPRDR
jgi:hypothetical protein